MNLGKTYHKSEVKKYLSQVFFPTNIYRIYFYFVVVQGAQYIGEICRYLLSVPESPEERSHGVEIMFGNGLRPQIWQQFVNR